MDQPLFHLWKVNQGLKLSRDLRTPENNHLLVYRVYPVVTIKAVYWADKKNAPSSYP